MLEEGTPWYASRVAVTRLVRSFPNALDVHRFMHCTMSHAFLAVWFHHESAVSGADDLTRKMASESPPEILWESLQGAVLAIQYCDAFESFVIATDLCRLSRFAPSHFLKAHPLDLSLKFDISLRHAPVNDTCHVLLLRRPYQPLRRPERALLPPNGPDLVIQCMRHLREVSNSDRQM